MNPSSLASARRQYGTNNVMPMSPGGQFYDGYGRKTGARIDGRVQRKTMMGGRSQGPLSSRPNRSESMAMEAEAALEAERQKGIARAQAEARQTSAPAGPAASPKPAGQLIPGHSPGSSMWVKNDSPLLKKTTPTAPPTGTTQGTVNGKDVSRAPQPTGISLLDAATGADGGAMLREARRKKAMQDRAKGRAKAESERRVRPLPSADLRRVA